MTDTFVVRRTIKLDFLGDEWKDAFVVMTPFSWDDNTTLLKFRKADSETIVEDQKELSELIKSRLVEGKGWNGEKLIPITRENVGALPVEAFTKIFQELQGGILSPKE